jgi:DNA invertase Pin-like site-specific DNA recombinase
MQARSGFGEAAQRANIMLVAEREGWDIIWLMDGQSGKDRDRPAFLRALQMIADHEADGLVSAKLDRVARSVQDFSQLMSWFVAGEKMLVILDPAIDTSTPNGRLVANVLASVAEWERDVIAGRTSDALQAKRALGAAICRASVVDDQELVRRIRSLRDGGASLQKIADVLNREGVPTLRGGTEWRVSAVQSALGYRRPPKEHKAPDLPQIKRRSRRAAA